MNKVSRTFEEYLKDVFMEQYAGIKDLVEESFDAWLSQLDVQEVIDYADVWGSEIRKEYEIED